MHLNQEVELSSGIHYKNEHVFLNQYTIIGENDNFSNYRFWTHYFIAGEIQEILKSSKFACTDFYQNVLPATSLWDGNNVTFYRAEK